MQGKGFELYSLSLSLPTSLCVTPNNSGMLYSTSPKWHVARGQGQELCIPYAVDMITHCWGED